VNAPPRYGVALPPHPSPIVSNIVDGYGQIGNFRNIIRVLGGGTCSTGKESSTMIVGELVVFAFVLAIFGYCVGSVLWGEVS